MLPGNKRVRTRVKPVEMPTIEAWPTASKAPRHLEPAPSSRLDVTPGHVKATASRRDALDPKQASVTDKPATAPLPASDKPVMPARDNPTTMATTAQESAREPQATQAPASDKPATPPLPANDRPVQAAGDKPVTMAVPLEAPTDSPRARQWIASIASSQSSSSRRAESRRERRRLARSAILA